MMLTQSRKATILVAEDDPGVRELVRTRLELSGYRTSCVSNGSDVLVQCRSSRPDALILDINLPGLDGFSILERWKRDRYTPPPTLVLTARHRAEDVRVAMALGAKDYLAKPFDDRIFLMRVARLLRKPLPAAAAGDTLEV